MFDFYWGLEVMIDGLCFTSLLLSVLGGWLKGFSVELQIMFEWSLLIMIN
jgi:hypothetical protein